MRHHAEQDAATPQSVVRGRQKNHAELSSRAVCVLLCRAAKLPVDLMEMLRRKELRPRVVGTLSAALAELIAIDRSADAVGGRVPVILLVVEPGEFTDLPMLMDSAKKYAPHAALWRFTRAGSPRLASLLPELNGQPHSNKSAAPADEPAAPPVVPGTIDAPPPPCRPMITFVPNWPPQTQRVIQTRVLTPTGFAAPLPVAPKLRLVDADESRHPAAAAPTPDQPLAAAGERPVNGAIPDPMMLTPEEVRLLLNSDEPHGRGHAEEKGGTR